MMRTDHMNGQTDEAFETLPTFEEYFDVLQANSDEFPRRRSR
jgi:hypothetical protein